MALTLELLGFQRYQQESLWAVESSSSSSAKLGYYTMITGDPRLSLPIDQIMSILTQEENARGDIIKIVLLTDVGAEGLDFKGVRAIHRMEPCLDLSHIEQVIGRGVRNFSHMYLNNFEQK